jgi:hypothetical protein
MRVRVLHLNAGSRVAGSKSVNMLFLVARCLILATATHFVPGGYVPPSSLVLGFLVECTFQRVDYILAHHRHHLEAMRRAPNSQISEAVGSVQTTKERCSLSRPLHTPNTDPAAGTQREASTIRIHQDDSRR